MYLNLLEVQMITFEDKFDAHFVMQTDLMKKFLAPQHWSRHGPSRVLVNHEL